MAFICIVFLLNGVLFGMIQVPGVAAQLGTTQFRLAGSGRTNVGRLEVYHNGVWGTVCDDSFDDTDATVACNSLGFGYVGQLVENQYGAGSGRIWMDELQCTGTEPSLDRCNFNDWGVTDCTHSEDVAISCPSLTAVRLANSRLSNEGRLEVNYNDEWGTVCDDGFDNAAARVACLMLGFGYGGRVINNTYGPGSGQIWLDETRCSGSETSLANCWHNLLGNTDCSHNEDVSVSCSLPAATTTTRAASSTKRATTTRTTSRASTTVSMGGACVKLADIVLLLDQSTSLSLRPDGTVDYDQWNFYLLNFVSDFIDQFRVHPNGTRIGLMLFSDTTEVLFNLSNNRTEMHQKLEEVRKSGIQGGSTNITNALQTSREMFTTERGARNDASKIVVLITDGNLQDANDVIEEGNRTKNDGTEIYCIELPSSGNIRGRNAVAQMASSPPDSHILNVLGYDTLRTDVLPRLVDSICGRQAYSPLGGSNGPVRPGVIGGIVAGIVAVLILM